MHPPSSSAIPCLQLSSSPSAPLASLVSEFGPEVIGVQTSPDKIVFLTEGGGVHVGGAAPRMVGKHGVEGGREILGGGIRGGESIVIILGADEPPKKLDSSHLSMKSESLSETKR